MTDPPKKSGLKKNFSLDNFLNVFPHFYYLDKNNPEFVLDFLYRKRNLPKNSDFLCSENGGENPKNLQKNP